MLITSRATMPSDPHDTRFAAPRSPDCPNDIGQEEAKAQLAEKAGLCGFCAWGFYFMGAEGHQQGEAISALQLLLVLQGDRHAGYKAQCGKVSLYRDQEGRVGALRIIDSEQRFFPGIKGNLALARYAARNPDMQIAETA